MHHPPTSDISLLQQLPVGFAYHQILQNECGAATDYVFLSVNDAFENMTGLKRSCILGRRVTEVLPRIMSGDFDWISTYSRVAASGESEEFEAYSEPLDRWFHVQAFSEEPGYFGTVIREITRHKQELNSLQTLLVMTEELLEATDDDMDFSAAVRALQHLSGAQAVAINTYDRSGTTSTTRAVAALPADIQRVSEQFGSGLVGMQWNINPHRLAVLRENRLIHFPSLVDTSLGAIPENMLREIEAALNLGAVYVIPLRFRDELFLGDIIFIMAQGDTVRNRPALEVYASHLATVLAHLRSEHTLSERELRLRQMSDQMSEVFWLQSADLRRVEYVSPSYEDIWGQPRDVLYDNPDSFMDAIVAEDREQLNQASRAYHAGQTFDVEFRIIRPDGEIRWIRSRLFPVHNADGEVIRHSGISQDITDSKQIEGRLQQLVEDQELLLNHIQTQVYYFTDPQTYGAVNDAHARFHGVPREQLSFSSAVDVLPDETARILIQGNTQAFVQRKPFRTEEWMRRCDGDMRLLSIMHIPKTDADGRVDYVVCSADDVTERWHMSNSLNRQLAFETLVSDVSAHFVGIAGKDVDQAIHFALKRTAEFFDVERSYLFQLSADGQRMSRTHEWCAPGIESQLSDTQNFPLHRIPWWRAQIEQSDHLHIPQMNVLPAEASAERLEFSRRKIRSLLNIPLRKDTRLVGILGYDHVHHTHEWSDNHILLLKIVAELIGGALARHQADERIRYLSFHDSLTGLHNRAYMEEMMVELDDTLHRPVSLIMVDLNGLKLVNDTYGHQTGDRMLQTTASLIRAACREDDVIARWGGDEFVILLPETSEEDAEKVAQRILERCRSTRVEEVPISMSVGSVTKTEAGTGLLDLLREAENRMYQYKLTEQRSEKHALLSSLLTTLEEKSFETQAHTLRMQDVALAMGRKLQLPPSELNRLSLCIKLHDIGKLSLSEEILIKSGPLTTAEWELMRKHPITGYRIARATQEFAHVAEDILHHHECWDGSGYPQGLAGEAIPLLSRITAVADAYEVMSYGRVYRPALSPEAVRAELTRCAGTQFDPHLIQCLLDLLDAGSIPNTATPTR